MANDYTPELQTLLADIETALLLASRNARQLAEQTGTRLIVRERHDSEESPASLQQPEAADNTPPSLLM